MPWMAWFSPKHRWHYWHRIGDIPHPPRGTLSCVVWHEIFFLKVVTYYRDLFIPSMQGTLEFNVSYICLTLRSNLCGSPIVKNVLWNPLISRHQIWLLKWLARAEVRYGPTLSTFDELLYVTSKQQVWIFLEGKIAVKRNYSHTSKTVDHLEHLEHISGEPNRAPNTRSGLWCGRAEHVG